jgi:hypothetical protein
VVVVSKARDVRNADGSLYGWSVRCPACDEMHVFPAKMNDASPGWAFNGNYDRPSFTPSLRLTWREADPSDPNPLSGKMCHSVLTDGIWNYCDDCTHALRGQKAQAPDL